MGAYDLGELLRRGLEHAIVGIWIHVGQAEEGLVAIVPLIVVR